MKEGHSKKFTDDWKEIPEGGRREVPVHLKRSLSMQELTAQYVAQALAIDRRMRDEPEDSDAAEDLELDEDGDEVILTPYELHAQAADLDRHVRRKEWMERTFAKKKPAPLKEQAEGLDKPGERKEDASIGGKDAKHIDVSSVRAADGVQQRGDGEQSKS